MVSRYPKKTEYEKSHAHGHESEEVDQGLDAGLLLIRAPDKAHEARDDDAHLDRADEYRDGVRPEKRDVLLLDLWDRRFVSTHWRGFESRADCGPNA